MSSQHSDVVHNCYCHLNVVPNQSLPQSPPTPWTVSCFWTNKFNSSDKAVELCNHIIFEDADVKLDSKTLTLDVKDFNNKTSGYKNVMRFKERHPKVKVEVLIGEFKTRKVLYDIAKRPENFTEGSKNFLNSLIFDSLHLVWGSPHSDAFDYFLTSANAKEQKKTLTTFLKKLKQVNIPFSFGIRGVLEIDCNMEVEEVYANADLVFFYPYSYHGRWEETTGAFAQALTRVKKNKFESRKRNLKF